LLFLCIGGLIFIALPREHFADLLSCQFLQSGRVVLHLHFIVGPLLLFDLLDIGAKSLFKFSRELTDLIINCGNVTDFEITRWRIVVYGFQIGSQAIGRRR
jgi:hypothetical protein